MAPPEAGAAIVEHDLVTALRSIPDDQRGWHAEKVSVRCQSCQAITVFDPTHVAQRCDFCGSSALIPVEEIKAPIRPESLLEFKIPESQVRDHVRAWYGNVWFAPNALKSRALTDTVRGIYLPYWTFDAQVHAVWTAESGYHYYETEYYTDDNGNQASRQVQRTRWVPASGHRQDFFDDTLVCASRGLPPELVSKFETFDTKQLTAYQPQFLAGWRAESYAVELMPAWGSAQARMGDVQRGRCSSDVPGDTQRNLSVRNEFSHVTFKHVLLPIWIAAYRYNGKPYQFLVNGQTGEVVGKAPWSVWKITLAILAAAIVITAISIAYYQYDQSQHPTRSTTSPAQLPRPIAPARPKH